MKILQLFQFFHETSPFSSDPVLLMKRTSMHLRVSPKLLRFFLLITNISLSWTIHVPLGALLVLK